MSWSLCWVITQFDKNQVANGVHNFEVKASGTWRLEYLILKEFIADCQSQQVWWFITGDVLATYIHFYGTIDQRCEERHGTFYLMPCVSNVNKVCKTNNVISSTISRRMPKRLLRSRHSFWVVSLAPFTKMDLPESRYGYDHMPSKVWYAITYPFQNSNGYTVGVWEWIGDFDPHIIMDVNTFLCWD